MAFHKAVCFICADDLCIPTQDASFEKTETTFSDALDSIGEYYNRNHLRANPERHRHAYFISETKKPTKS